MAAGLRDPAHGKVRRVPHLYDFPQTPITPFFILFYCLFKATPEAYGNSQARGPVRAAAASLCHSHSNSRSEPCLRPTPQRTQRWILNPLSGARDQTCILMDTSQICSCCPTTGTPCFFNRKMISDVIVYESVCIYESFKGKNLSL